MGRAKGTTTAAAPARRRRTQPLGMTRNQQELLWLATRGDFEPFLVAVQTLSPQSEALLDSDVTPAVCDLAITHARIEHADALDGRVAAAGIENPAVRAGILRAVSYQAERDLQRALYWLVEQQDAGKRAWVATDETFRAHADALLDNRLSEALGQPVDAELVHGVWRILRDI